MYEEENLTPAEQALESALGQLKPALNIMNRDKLMFNAGRVSVGRKQPWQILSGTLMILLLCSAIIRQNPVSETAEQNQFQIAQTQYEPDEVETPDSLAYQKMRENIIKHGLDALQLQQTPRHSEPAMNQKQWLDTMLSS